MSSKIIVSKRTAAVIGKGPSIKNCKSDYINRFDDIIICNKPVFEGYESYIPKRANIQFRNKHAENFSKNELDELGLQLIVYTDDHTNFKNNQGIEKISCRNFLSEDIFHLRKYNFKEEKSVTGYQIRFNDNEELVINHPSTGIIALTCAIMSKNYDKIFIAGLDLNEQDKSVYYYNTKDYEEHEKIKLGKQYSINGIQKTEVLHEKGEKLLNYILYLFKKYNNIIFEVTTTNENFKKMCCDIENVKFI